VIVEEGFMRRFYLLALLFHFALIAAAAQTPATKANNVLFAMPEGWERSEKNGAIVLVPPDTPADKAICSLRIEPGRVLEGDFRAWFDAEMERVKSGLTIIAGGGVTSANLKDGYPILLSLFIAEDQDKNLSYHFYLAANPGNRAEMISYIALTQEAYNRYRSALEKIIDSLNFANVSKN
jgi:hypothetical protein